MADVCSRVDYLLLHPSEVTASPNSVLRMLRRMSSIDSLDLERGFGNVVTSDILKVIASYPALDQAVLPYVRDDYLLALQTDADMQLFPKLRYLYTGATAESLRLYHRVAPKIEALGLTNETLKRTNDVLTAASKFRQLTSFTAQLSTSSIIRGEELIHLAQGCQNLEELKIGIDSWSEIKPSAVGITDELIEQLAPYLRNLRNFYLLFVSDTQDAPGCIRSIQSLGRHCKHLEELVLSCRPDWEWIATLSQVEAVPLAAGLEQLQLLPNGHMRQCLTEEEHSTLLTIWRSTARIWLPHIDLMMIRDADDWEDAFVDALVPADIGTDEQADDEDSKIAVDGAEELGITTTMDQVTLQDL
ncbi:hypothetical protein N0V86_009584 [Didymella sp. IMI 355093]|nr:hypothetical protein N0V86_009584 [Didymella sp. IMI 355093]